MTDTREFHFDIRLAGGATVTRATVTLYAITRAEPRQLERREVTGPRFEAELPVGDAAELLYAVADIESCSLDGTTVETGERTVQLVAVFDGGSRRVALSEPLTVATAYCFSRFTRVGAAGAAGGVVISDPHRAAHLAYGMKNNFVTTDGAISEVIQSPPNGLQTNSFAMLDFLANLVFYSLIDPGVYDAFTRLAGAGSLYAALLDLALSPFGRSRAVYSLIAERPQPYSPSLPQLELPAGASPVPHQWTLTVKVNGSGARNFLIGGPGYVVFDRNDRAWIANNVRQGTPDSATFCVVLEPDGSPAPFSPLFGGGVLGAGFGAAVNRARDTVYIGNFGWGAEEWNPQTGSVSAFGCEGAVLSPSNGFTAGLSRVQGMAVDRHDNLWMSSWGTQDPMPPAPSRYHFESADSAAVVYVGGDPSRVASFPFDSPYHQTFDVAIDGAGHGLVSNSGNGPHDVRSSVFKLRLERERLVEVARWESRHEALAGRGYEMLRQVAVSPAGEVFVAAVASNRVIRFDSDLRRRGELDNEIHGPWGLTFDRDGVLYVANFRREMSFEEDDPESDLGPYGVTVVRDVDDESTAELMTLPTGGEAVTLANGLPLYGNPETSSGRPIPLPSYDPLMRLTSTQIDRAGNLWACNNWKPSASIDAARGNPGGDGMVIFVGVAAPARWPEG